MSTTTISAFSPMNNFTTFSAGKVQQLFHFADKSMNNYLSTSSICQYTKNNSDNILSAGLQRLLYKTIWWHTEQWQ